MAMERCGDRVDARDLDRVRANHQALTPLGFLDWAADVYGSRTGCIYGQERRSWAEIRRRCRRLASGLRGLGVRPGDIVSVLLPNVPAMLECQFGVPMAGAILNALNDRLDAATLVAILGHAEATVLITDTTYAPVVREALCRLAGPILVVDLVDPAEAGQALGQLTYEELLDQGDPEAAVPPPTDEWSPISLCYTSGTTGPPKGVICNHRGAYLNALGSALMLGLRADSVYLWTLPMSHCNGWTLPWAITAAGGTHVCLRRPEPGRIFRLLVEEQVTHLFGAPPVLNMLVHCPREVLAALRRPVEVLAGGAAPTDAVIEAMEAMGFRVTHAYGLTEAHGPAMFSAPQRAWQDLPSPERARMMARQGVRSAIVPELQVADPTTLRPVPNDATTLGEIMLRGHSVMAGYLKDPAATAEAFAGGWYHTGDLAVVHADGYVELRDRVQDIIVSGGENISSLEVEQVLQRHPAVLEAAVVARPDPVWGEVPCAFLVLKPDASRPDPAQLLRWLRQQLASYKLPRRFVFGTLPKTATGRVRKDELRQRARLLD
ncbi:AMP-binding protein [Geminicoccus flavidas]|uniref:AMP-binding protein n=1 Tax=Geminicoccus flavidas TaxID=2506407 RepID=UPI001F314FDC|nr:AMP-binding protein [Geminicoccus flavidas]